MTTSRRQNLLGAAAVLCVMLLSADRVVVGPLIRVWHARTTQINTLEVDLEHATVMADRVDVLSARVALFRSRQLPENPSDAENVVIRSVREWADASAVTAVSMRPHWGQTRDGSPVLELRVTGKADLGGAARFLYAVETSPLPLRVPQVELVHTGDPSDLSLTVRIEGILTRVADREPGSEGPSS